MAVRYLLDTNVLSEALKTSPDERVIRWLGANSSADYAISVLTLGEFEKGVSSMAAGRRRASLEKWLTIELPRQFSSGRVLAIDDQIALSWGRLTASGRAMGRPLPVVDGLLLATAEARGLTLVTRNEADCEGRGVPILNPWRVELDH